MAGQTVQIKNDDPTTHNIHPTPKDNREWNESQPPCRTAIEKNFAREEIMLPVKCNQHPWMKMYVNVVKSPFFAVTDKDGKYEIKGLPPGDYTLAFVHEKLGEQTQKVTVGPKDAKTVDQSFKAGGDVAILLIECSVLERGSETDPTLAGSEQVSFSGANRSGFTGPRSFVLKAIATQYNRAHHAFAVFTCMLCLSSHYVAGASSPATTQDCRYLTGRLRSDPSTRFRSWSAA